MDDTNNRPEGTGEGSLPPTEGMSAGSATGQQIGPYRLLDRLGEGGMGEVWLAEQGKPVRRTVALKVIKQGMDTKQVVARFEAERQALAMMDHPAIAKVYDAGATPRGRPYFAMEHVKGVPITEYCDRNKLTNRERLELFMQVCEGVQHAHQKAVIHRDLKPGNVLVSVQDGKPAPKIIDFGVAKATAQKLTEQTMYTQLGVMIGTPAYMSPEQAEMTGLDVDTRTDVYSLGVMLYELIVGALPFDMRELLSAGREGVVRKIREDEPPKPSNRLASLGGGSTESAERRRTELPALKRELSGDLDWITMKALEKDRTRRYASPGDLAADLGRHLKDEPVLAGPPSAVYRAKKFVRRNRLAVSFAAVVALLLVGFAATMAVQARRIARERDRANDEAVRAKRVSQFMTRLFAIPDPGESRGNEVTAREILDQGAMQIERGLKDEPLIRARMTMTIATTYRSLGLLDPAKAALEQAVEILETDPVRDDATLGEALSLLGHVYFKKGGDYSVPGAFDLARQHWESALRLQRSALRPDDPDLAFTISGLAWVHFQQRDREQAARFANEAHLIWTSRPDTADWRAAVNASLVGWIASLRGDYDQSLALNDYAVEVFERAVERGEYWPGDVATLNLAAHDYRAAGRLEEAVRLFERSLEYHEGLFGRDHTAVANDCAGLSQTLLLLGDVEGAYEYRRRVTEFREASPEYAQSYMLMGSRLQLADLAMRLGKRQEARALYTKAIDSFRQGVQIQSMANETEAEVLGKLAARVAGSGSYEDALPLFEIASLFAANFPSLRATIHREHATLLRRIGRDAEAAEHETRAAELSAEDAAEGGK